jgi:2-polyprenyl-6-hydroxyphenyl methylase/3-demethylubiquinone-9 3-methyltransferase
LVHGQWDHSTHEAFYSYYARASVTPTALARFRRLRDIVTRIAAASGKIGILDVADIGCGAGTLSTVWAEAGHRVVGLDISEKLVELARERAKAGNTHVEFFVGTAAHLPWQSQSIDACCMPELLEHVPDWERCLKECDRVLRRGGVLYLSTSNLLCPRQDEFNLPGYSWYPPFVKRQVVQLAKTTRPDLANYATYPALHWFSYYELRDFLRPLGFRTMDRFDIALTNEQPAWRRFVLQLIRHVPPLRFLGHMASAGLIVIAIKDQPTRSPRNTHH